MGAGRGADGEEDGGGEKESDEEALEVYGFHACTIGLEAGSVKFSDLDGPEGGVLAILYEDAAPEECRRKMCHELSIPLGLFLSAVSKICRGEHGIILGFYC